MDTSRPWLTLKGALLKAHILYDIKSRFRITLALE